MPDSTDHLKTVAAIRKRAPMYIGALDSHGMMYAVCEAVGNSVDQFLMQKATRITITVESDRLTVTVRDDGDGLPFEKPSAGDYDSLATEWLTLIHSSPTADGHAPHVHLPSFHGIGIVALNAVSKHFECQSWREGALWMQRFHCGVPEASPVVLERGHGRGTEIRFTLDADLFGDARIDIDSFRDFLAERVHLFHGLLIDFNSERLYARRGLATLAESMLQNIDHDDATWSNRSAFHMNQTYDDMIIHAAAAGCGTTTTWRAWANCRLMPKGGTHQSAFQDAVADCSWTPSVGLIHVMMKDAEYTGSTIERLNMPHFRERIAKRIRSHLHSWCVGIGISALQPSRPPVDSDFTESRTIL